MKEQSELPALSAILWDTPKAGARSMNQFMTEQKLEREGAVHIHTCLVLLQIAQGQMEEPETFPKSVKFFPDT
jgi:hypothetical protein